MNNGKAKILIVDDERGLRLGTKRLLESEGYEVDTAENGEEGIRLGKSNDYDIAIIDLKMPDKDGIEVLQNIKTAFPNTVCIIATAYASYETAIQATKLGAYSYIPKPFTPDELLSQLKRAFEHRILTLESERLKKEREERLLELAYEKTRLNTVINSIVDGVLIVNKNGETALFNPAALKYLNLNDLPLEKYCLDILPSELAETIKKIIEKEKYEQTAYSTQIEIKPNKELVIEAVCSPIPHPNSQIAGAAVVISDITEHKKIEAIKNQFVSMVAHELKTPIAAVLGYIKIILDKSLNITPEQAESYLQRSYSRLQGLLEMVNDLLDISRMELKTKQLEIKELDLVEIIKSTIEFLEFEIEKKKIKTIFNPPAEFPKIKADQSQISRLFTNLISNAIKYNKEEGEIRIRLRVDGKYAVVEVEDTGIGMSEKEKANLFSEFYRIKNEKTRGIPGTGLGLSIVKRIVETYSGKIEVVSEPNKGSNFIVYLPISR